MDSISPASNEEKGVGKHYENGPLYQSISSVTIPKEVFESLYSPQSVQTPRIHTRQIFVNAFPMPLMGFLMASTPLGCTLMGWRGAGGNGAALIGVFYFFGGMLQIIGSVLEWINGNTFPFVVFASYGAFWLSFGATLQPDFNALGAYVNTSQPASVQAAGQDEFYNTYAFFFMVMTVLTFLYVLASLRTNLILFVVFLFIDLAFFMLMSSYWVLAEGRNEVGMNLQIAAGACVFVFCMFGWYLFFSIILESLDFPFKLPLFDLSGRLLRRKSRKQDDEDPGRECDGQRPECNRCKGYGFSCTWAVRRRKPLASPGDTDGTIGASDFPATVITGQGVHAACSYVMKSYEALIRSFQEKLDETDQAALDLTLGSIRQRLPGELTDQVHSENDPQPPPLHDNEQSPTYVGQASDLYFFKTIESCMRGYNTSELGGDDLREQYYDQTEIPEYTTFLGRPLLCPSQEEGARYLDIYFSTIHVAYPFLCKSVVLTHFERIWTKKVKDHQDRSMLALLNFIFAIGSYYLSFPHCDNVSSQLHFQYFEQGAFFSNELMAKCNLVNVWISLVRCFFLLAICQTDRCWNTLGFAIRMAQSIGLHVDTPPPRRGLAVSFDTECELRRRTWYSMYVLDRLLALQLGRPMAIRQADFHVTMPSRSGAISFDSDESTEISNADDDMSVPSMMDYFLHVIHFSSIVEHVIHELYKPTQAEVPADKLLSDASTIDTSLLRWRANLPHHLRFDLGHTFEKSVIFQRQRNMLAVKFHHLRALVHRPFLAVPVLQHHDETFMALLQRDQAQIQEAERKCIVAAQQTAHLLHNVADERCLVQDFPWWQMISCLICSSSILFVADVFSENHERFGELSSYLHEDAETCLKVFEALSVKSPAAKQAVGMLQGLARLRSVSQAKGNATEQLTEFINHAETSTTVPTGSISPGFPPDGLVEFGIEWPSEISNSMEWSIQALDAAGYAMGEKNFHAEKDSVR